MSQSKIVDPSCPVNYAQNQAPPNYVCGDCGAANCKLWREYQTFLCHQFLRCCDCAGRNQDTNTSEINADGKIAETRSLGYIAMTDQIGWLVPAVPTPDNDTYWGYTSVPQAGVEWWRRLPNRPARENPVV